MKNLIKIAICSVTLGMVNLANALVEEERVIDERLIRDANVHEDPEVDLPSSPERPQE